ncbi:hypothetical protein [Pseudomonas sp. Gutcm_11s]|uniref:hypothetical protein n=1 Tax=Pseudomonas sp. Gutcm_11s TaxID=3026088 RepID=UPI002360AF6A|nr:hypothetical protein [Pseudomonas sp. Gutcm_11s]MDD0841487.1 hypothetical protein [Pseudomonas sp. Gutcm_11s]
MNTTTLKLSPAALALSDAMLILAPLAIFLFILFMKGEYSSVVYKAEWSFVMVFYIIEVIKDQIKTRRLEGYHEAHTEAGVAFYSILLSLGVLFLYADYEHSQGFVGLNSKAFITFKLFLFLGSFMLFMFHRHKKYRLLSKEPQTI